MSDEDDTQMEEGEEEEEQVVEFFELLISQIFCYPRTMQMIAERR